MAKDKDKVEKVIEVKRYHLHAYLDYKIISPKNQFYYLKKYSSGDPYLTIEEWEEVLGK